MFLKTLSSNTCSVIIIIGSKQLFGRYIMLIFNRYKVVNMFRFKLFVILSLVIILIFTLYNLNAFSLNKEDYNNYIEILVKDGDTIWNIAEKYNSDGNDLRQLVYDISKINDVEDSVIVPGQKII